MPILPGAVLLDEALRIIEMDLGIDLTQWQLTAAKFLESVRPGDPLDDRAHGSRGRRGAIYRSSGGPVRTCGHAVAGCRRRRAMTAEPSRILDPRESIRGQPAGMDRLPRTRQPAAAAVDGLLVAASGTPARPAACSMESPVFLPVLSARPRPFAPLSRARARPAAARARLLQARAVFRHLHPRSGLPGQRTIRALPVQRRRGSSRCRRSSTPAAALF